MILCSAPPGTSERADLITTQCATYFTPSSDRVSVCIEPFGASAGGEYHIRPGKAADMHPFIAVARARSGRPLSFVKRV